MSVEEARIIFDNLRIEHWELNGDDVPFGPLQAALGLQGLGYTEEECQRFLVCADINTGADEDLDFSEFYTGYCSLQAATEDKQLQRAIREAQRWWRESSMSPSQNPLQKRPRQQHDRLEPVTVRLLLSGLLPDAEREMNLFRTEAFQRIQQELMCENVHLIIVDLRNGEKEASSVDQAVVMTAAELDMCAAVNKFPFFISFIGQRLGARLIMSPEELHSISSGMRAPRLQAAVQTLVAARRIINMASLGSSAANTTQRQTLHERGQIFPPVENQQPKQQQQQQQQQHARPPNLIHPSHPSIAVAHSPPSSLPSSPAGGIRSKNLLFSKREPAATITRSPSFIRPLTLASKKEQQRATRSSADIHLLRSTQHLPMQAIEIGLGAFALGNPNAFFVIQQGVGHLMPPIREPGTKQVGECFWDQALAMLRRDPLAEGHLVVIRNKIISRYGPKGNAILHPRFLHQQQQEKNLCQQLDFPEMESWLVSSLTSAIREQYPVIDSLSQEISRRARQDMLSICHSLAASAASSNTATVLSMIADQKKLGPILVSGPAGCGKTAVLADVVRSVHESYPNAVVFHASSEGGISCGPSAITFEEVLRKLYSMLNPRSPPLIEDIDEMIADLPSRLEKATSSILSGISGSVIICLDCVDRADPPLSCNFDVRKPHDLLLRDFERWFPGLMRQVVWIFSCHRQETIDALEKKFAAALRQVQIAPLIPSEQSAIVLALTAPIRLWDGEVGAKLARAKGRRNPLWLKLVCHEARFIATKPSLLEWMGQLPADVGLLAHYVMTSVEMEFGVAAAHTLFLAVASAMGNSLSESELRVLMCSRSTAPVRLDDAAISRLIHRASNCFQSHSSRIEQHREMFAFSNYMFWEAAIARYCRRGEEVSEIRAILAAFHRRKLEQLAIQHGGGGGVGVGVGFDDEKSSAELLAHDLVKKIDYYENRAFGITVHDEEGATLSKEKRSGKRLQKQQQQLATQQGIFESRFHQELALIPRLLQTAIVIRPPNEAELFFGHIRAAFSNTPNQVTILGTFNDKTQRQVLQLNNATIENVGSGQEQQQQKGFSKSNENAIEANFREGAGRIFVNVPILTQPSLLVHFDPYTLEFSPFNNDERGKTAATTDRLTLSRASANLRTPYARIVLETKFLSCNFHVDHCIDFSEIQQQQQEQQQRYGKLEDAGGAVAFSSRSQSGSRPGTTTHLAQLAPPSFTSIVDSGTFQVFNSVCLPAIGRALQGKPSAIIGWGPVGGGKTSLLFGRDKRGEEEANAFGEEMEGAHLSEDSVPVKLEKGEYSAEKNPIGNREQQEQEEEQQASGRKRSIFSSTSRSRPTSVPSGFPQATDFYNREHSHQGIVHLALKEIFQDVKQRTTSRQEFSVKMVVYGIHGSNVRQLAPISGIGQEDEFDGALLGSSFDSNGEPQTYPIAVLDSRRRGGGKSVDAGASISETDLYFHGSPSLGAADYVESRSEKLVDDSAENNGFNPGTASYRAQTAPASLPSPSSRMTMTAGGQTHGTGFSVHWPEILEVPLDNDNNNKQDGETEDLTDEQFRPHRRAMTASSSSVSRKSRGIFATNKAAAIGAGLASTRASVKRDLSAQGMFPDLDKDEDAFSQRLSRPSTCSLTTTATQQLEEEKVTTTTTTTTTTVTAKRPLAAMYKRPVVSSSLRSEEEEDGEFPLVGNQNLSVVEPKIQEEEEDGEKAKLTARTSGTDRISQPFRATQQQAGEDFSVSEELLEMITIQQEGSISVLSCDEAERVLDDAMERIPKWRRQSTHKIVKVEIVKRTRKGHAGAQWRDEEERPGVLYIVEVAGFPKDAGDDSSNTGNQMKSVNPAATADGIADVLLHRELIEAVQKHQAKQQDYFLLSQRGQLSATKERRNSTVQSSSSSSSSSSCNPLLQILHPVFENMSSSIALLVCITPDASKVSSDALRAVSRAVEMTQLSWQENCVKNRVFSSLADAKMTEPIRADIVRGRFPFAWDLAVMCLNDKELKKRAGDLQTASDDLRNFPSGAWKVFASPVMLQISDFAAAALKLLQLVGYDDESNRKGKNVNSAFASAATAVLSLEKMMMMAGRRNQAAINDGNVAMPPLFDRNNSSATTTAAKLKGIRDNDSMDLFSQENKYTWRRLVEDVELLNDVNISRHRPRSAALRIDSINSSNNSNRGNNLDIAGQFGVGNEDGDDIDGIENDRDDMMIVSNAYSVGIEESEGEEPEESSSSPPLLNDDVDNGDARIRTILASQQQQQQVVVGGSEIGIVAQPFVVPPPHSLPQLVKSRKTQQQQHQQQVRDYEVPRSRNGGSVKNIKQKTNAATIVTCLIEWSDSLLYRNRRNDGGKELRQCLGAWTNMVKLIEDSNNTLRMALLPCRCIVNFFKACIGVLDRWQFVVASLVKNDRKYFERVERSAFACILAGTAVNLELSNCRLFDEDAAVLCSFLQQGVSMKRLNVSRNCFSAHGMQLLAAQARSSDVLELLDMRWNRGGADGVWHAVQVMQARHSQVVLATLDGQTHTTVGAIRAGWILSRIASIASAMKSHNDVRVDSMLASSATPALKRCVACKGWAPESWIEWTLSLSMVIAQMEVDDKAEHQAETVAHWHICSGNSDESTRAESTEEHEEEQDDENSINVSSESAENDKILEGKTNRSVLEGSDEEGRFHQEQQQRQQPAIVVAPSIRSENKNNNKQQQPSGAAALSRLRSSIHGINQSSTTTTTTTPVTDSSDGVEQKIGAIRDSFLSQLSSKKDGNFLTGNQSTVTAAASESTTNNSFSVKRICCNRLGQVLNISNSRCWKSQTEMKHQQQQENTFARNDTGNAPIDNSNNILFRIPVVRSNQRIRHRVICPLGCAALGEILRESILIKRLVLSGHGLRNVHVEQLVIGLAGNSSLEILDLSNNEIREKGVDALIAFAQTRPRIKAIDVADNPLETCVLARLACALILPGRGRTRNIQQEASLSRNTATRMLDKLGGKDLGYKRLSFEGFLQAPLAAHFLLLDHSVEQLVVNDPGIEGAHQVLRAVARSPSVRSLTLTGEWVSGRENALEIAMLLANAPRLLHLVTDNGRIPLTEITVAVAGTREVLDLRAWVRVCREEEMIILARVLQRASSIVTSIVGNVPFRTGPFFSLLTSIDLCGYGLGEFEIRLIAEMLRLSVSLRSCNLARNSGGGTGAFAIAESVVHSGRLEWIDMRENGVLEVDILAIESQLRLANKMSRMILRGFGPPTPISHPYRTLEFPIIPPALSFHHRLPPFFPAQQTIVLPLFSRTTVIAAGDDETFAAVVEGDEMALEASLTDETAKRTNAIDALGNTPLHIASSRNNNIRIMAVLVRSGAMIDASNWRGETPLHHAARNGQIRAVDLLLEMKANPVISDSLGFTPLHYSVLSQHTEVTRRLLLAAPLFTPRSISGLTILHCAILANSSEIIEILADEPTFPELIASKTFCGESALHFAVGRGSDMVRLIAKFLRRGKERDAVAIAKMENKQGETAADWAERMGDDLSTAIIQQLLSG